MVDTSNILRDYKKEVEGNAIIQRYEREVGPDRNSYVFDSDVANYDKSFRRLCPEGLQTLVDGYRTEKHKPSMLMLMGQNGVMRELDTEGIAVSLAEDRNEEQRLVDATQNRGLVEGDLLRYGRTFAEIRARMRSVGIEHFDVAVLRGVQGNLKLSKHPEIQGKVLSKTIELISSNGGVLLIQGGTRIRPERLIIELQKLSQFSQLKIELHKTESGYVEEIKITKLGEINIDQEFKNQLRRGL
jgi:hypothetical protein